MEIRDFAEAVLRSPDLADKLVTPDALRDDRPGPALVDLPAMPARAPRLALDREDSRSFPKRFDRPEARGLALHFFANHELLAMELMALLLLRFPDAPASFRMGIARTITEEQDHLRRYAARMRALGVELGDAPVNGFFWRTMRDAKGPLEFVAQMSLTFEQANLDYCVHYRDLFAAADDVESAELLEKVYEDEIGHVAHGLTWFRRWHDPERSDWEAYQAALPDPMTAARAKGPRLDLAGRRRAGLDDDFVRHLRVFSASKGRRPRLWAFEPAMEDRFAGRSTDRAPVRALSADLAPLMGLLASPDDRLVLETPPSLQHLEHLDAAGFELPETLTWEEAFARRAAPAHAGDRPAALVPWGWSPRMVEAANRLEVATMDLEVVRRASSKLEGRRRLEEILSQDDFREVVREDVLGFVAEDPERVFEAAVTSDRALVVKAPFSASGRHRIVLASGATPSAAARGFVEKSVERHGGVWVAPWLDKIRDLSTTLHVFEDGRVRVDPSLWLENEPQGGYVGHVLAPYLRGVDAADRRALNRGVTLSDRLAAVAQHVGEHLAAAGYVGPAGVDHLVYRGADGQSRLHPLLEVNARLTMGHVAHALRRRLVQGRVGVIRHVSRAAVERSTGLEWVEWVRAVRAAAPVRRGPRGLESGVVFLTDPETTRSVCAVLAVGESLEVARRILVG